MNIALKMAVGFFAAVVGSMGMGGGGILLMYLSAFTSTDQLKAQGINLIFFVPIAAVSIIMHLKNKLINKKTTLFIIAFAVPAAAAGAFVSGLLSKTFLRKAFAVFLLLIGIREIITSFSKKEKRT